MFFYLLLMMSVLLCLSHGTQDLYPDFLKSVPGHRGKDRDRDEVLYGIPIIYNIGAIVGALFFGHLSQRMGRRKAIMLALVVSLISIPAWAFGASLGVLVAGSFLMQVGVQGAFGVIPAHLKSFLRMRCGAFFPESCINWEFCWPSPATAVEFMLRDHFGYPWALTVFGGAVTVADDRDLLVWSGGAQSQLFAGDRDQASIGSERISKDRSDSAIREKAMNEKRIGIIMNGVTGRMGLNQHLVRSILAIRNQGGVALDDGSRLMPDPILVGRNAAKLEQIAKEHGVARWTTDLRGALANQMMRVYFDAQVTTLRAPER